MKLLYALQYHPGDMPAAMALARLIADVIPDKRCAEADFLFAASAKADFDFNTIRYVGRRFANVRTFRCVRDFEGWPKGPNNQAHETARYFAQQVLAGRWKYDGIFLGEPDCVPLRRDFLRLIAEEWSRGPQTVLGPWVTNGPKPWNQHINGNCVMGPQFIYNNPSLFRCEDWMGWDVGSCETIMAHGRASMWIYSDYQLGTPQNTWKGCEHLFSRRELQKPHPMWKLRFQDVAYLHGAKRWDLAHDCVRHRLLHEPIRHHENIVPSEPSDEVSAPAQ